MSKRAKLNSEKVVKAMTLNQNEDRILAKTFGTLALEKEFSKKVLNLQMRTVKNNFRNLKEKVSRIKSNLTPEEILYLRELDAEGKLKPMTTFNLNAAMKIAAAARRLKLDPDRKHKSRSAGMQRLYRENTAPAKLLHNRPATTNNMKRSNSVTGVFIDAPEPDTSVRRSSIDGGITLRPLSANVNVTAEEQGHSVNEKTAGRPSTSAGLAIDREKSRVSFRTASTASQIPYSSHSMGDKDNSGRQVNDRKLSFITSVDDVIENNLGGDLFEDRRQELINEEQLFYSTLERKKDHFLDRVDNYLKDNPPVEFNIQPNLALEKIARENILTEEEEEEEEQSHTSHLPANVRRQIKRQFEIERTFTTEEEYMQKGNDLWKDMNKTRYLRVPDEKLDFTGVVTLAKDQMKLYELLRSTEPSHIVNVK